jgi:hypothetical protein
MGLLVDYGYPQDFAEKLLAEADANGYGMGTDMWECGCDMPWSPHDCGERDCPVGWHQQWEACELGISREGDRYALSADYATCDGDGDWDYSSENVDSIEEFKRLEQEHIKQCDEAANAYLRYVAKTGRDPIGEFHADTPTERRAAACRHLGIDPATLPPLEPERTCECDECGKMFDMDDETAGDWSVDEDSEGMSQELSAMCRACLEAWEYEANQPPVV